MADVKIGIGEAGGKNSEIGFKPSAKRKTSLWATPVADEFRGGGIATDGFHELNGMKYAAF